MTRARPLWPLRCARSNTLTDRSKNGPNLGPKVMGACCVPNGIAGEKNA
jgi:hypothetical protein